MKSQTKQRGAILLISLIFMLVLTIVGTSSIKSVTLEERMVSNMHDSTLSFQAAESGLRDCEEFFIEVNHRVEASSNNGQNVIWEKDTVADQSSNPDFWWQDFGFWEDIGTPYDPAVDLTGYENGQGKVAKNPRCIREYVGTETDSVDDLGFLQQEGWSLYRITAAAAGADENTVTVLSGNYYTRHK